jgi:hypothetical protein
MQVIRTIGGANWTTKLAGAVEASNSGDVIAVETWHAAQMGHTAARRMKGTEDHGIVFECGGKPVDYLDADDPPPGSGFDEDGHPLVGGGS